MFDICGKTDGPGRIERPDLRCASIIRLTVAEIETGLFEWNLSLVYFADVKGIISDVGLIGLIIRWYLHICVWRPDLLSYTRRIMYNSNVRELWHQLLSVLLLVVFIFLNFCIFVKFTVISSLAESFNFSFKDLHACSVGLIFNTSVRDSILTN